MLPSNPQKLENDTGQKNGGLNNVALEGQGDIRSRRCGWLMGYVADIQPLPHAPLTLLQSNGVSPRGERSVPG